MDTDQTPTTDQTEREEAPVAELALLCNELCLDGRTLTLRTKVGDVEIEATVDRRQPISRQLEPVKAKAKAKPEPVLGSENDEP